MCMDTDTAVDPDMKMFILIHVVTHVVACWWTDGRVSHLRHFLCLLSSFFLAVGKAHVIQPLCLRSAKSWRMKQSSSKYWSKKTLLCMASLMITALLSSNRRRAMVSNELVPWPIGKNQGKCTFLCVHKYNKNIHSSIWRSVPVVCTHKAFAGYRNTCHILNCIRTNGLHL